MTDLTPGRHEHRGRHEAPGFDVTAYGDPGRVYRHPNGTLNTAPGVGMAEAGRRIVETLEPYGVSISDA